MKFIVESATNGPKDRREVEIGSLEELIAFMDSVENPLVLGGVEADDPMLPRIRLSLLIYNGYIE